MKLKTCAIVIAALGMSAPVFAQTAAGSTAASQNVGASGVNETTGTSNPKNVKAQGSGSGGADVGAKRTTAGSDRTTRGTNTATTGKTTGASGVIDPQNVGASGVNETTGTSNPKNVKAQGSGSGGADVGANTKIRKRSDRASTGSTGAATGATGGTSGSNAGASGVNETTGPSASQGVKPQGSGSGSRY